MQIRKSCPAQSPPDLASRATDDQLNQELFECLHHPLTQVILESVGGYCLILNKERQVLAGNQELLDALGLTSASAIQGKRPGEVFTCIHAYESPDGCGNSESCAQCGALLTILAAQFKGEAAAGECVISFLREGCWVAREFHVRANPVVMGFNDFLVFVLRDASSEKRRENLEKIFLHDLLNTLQGLHGWTELLQFPNTDPDTAARHIIQLSDQLTQEVLAQRLLLQAEQGGLNPDIQPLLLEKLISELEERLLLHRCRKDKNLSFDIESDLFEIKSDAVILQRVLFNMLINALEATTKGGEVTLRARRESGCIVFEVHNPGWMPEDVARMVFQRSFSTKGSKGRGIGTYSMKLLGENVLKGKVSFGSSQASGTSFLFALPEGAEP